LIPRLAAPRFFFLRVTGRRRIGKTALVVEALRRARRHPVAYIYVPAADPAGVVLGARDHLRRSGVSGVEFDDLFGLAAALGDLARKGWVVVLDEFQAFADRALSGFTTALQAQVDALRAPGATPVTGGLVVLGSIQSEMEALLAGRRAPLFGRATDVLHVDHLRPSTLAHILRRHGRHSGDRLLFAWTLLQGIPKYWRDAAEVGALAVPRREALRRLFFSGTAPLAADGTGWLLDELRGRYDPLLRYLARCPGAGRPDIAAHIAQVAGHASPQVGAWLAALEDKFRLIARRVPAFSTSKSRDGRYAIEDNFLVAWLGAIADPVAFLGVRPLAPLLDEADSRVATLEGRGLERLVAALLEERSRRGVGDFALTEPVRGWWDRAGHEIDAVAVDRAGRRVRVATCKRNPDKLVADLAGFEAHVQAMMDRVPEIRDWTVERVAISPELGPRHRRACAKVGFLAQDIDDLLDGLPSG
jgi:AAA+ ATPase superfamily predicted ATPase